MKQLKIFAAISLIIFLMAFSIRDNKKLTIWMIGDSTMSIKEKKYYPETGWGMPFANFWDSSVTIENRAKNGRSTKSFLKENSWKPVLDNLKEGDYVFIQFGHNDEIPTKKNATTPIEFKDNLVKYVVETRSKKAIPVLFTSVARRKFDSTGNLVSTHEEYAGITRAVAAEQKVVLIDLDVKSSAVLKEMGIENSIFLFNHLKPGQHPNYPEGKMDDTHFSELGARRMAELALAEIRILLPDLATRITKPVAKK
ncbi:MAG: rhamnogalacturonan acetylesterase [Sphingobacteriales bacterium]|nr:MAG: rhamnogalacturonan acetylesterase [Sphingobacteriales bacterium]